MWAESSAANTMPFTVLDVLLHQPLYPAALIHEECCAGGIAMALHHLVDNLLQHKLIHCLADDLHTCWTSQEARWHPADINNLPVML